MALIQDIALRAGVSRNTASKVLNNKSGVSNELREKVLSLAQEMGYKKIVTDVREESSQGTIGISVLVTNPEFSSFWMQMLNSIANELDKLDIDFVYHCIRYREQERFKMPLIIKEKRVKGIIVINVYGKEVIEEIAQVGLPVVYYDIPVHKRCKEVKGDVLLLEGTKSMEEITESIIRQGIEEVGFIGDITYSTTIYERWMGYKEGMLKHKLPIKEEYCITQGIKHHLYELKELGEALNGLERLPDAFVCANDDIAYMTMKAIKMRYGKNNILLSGYDNIKVPLGESNYLTTVEVDVEYVGKRLVGLLMERIKDIDKRFEIIRIETTPILKESTNKLHIGGK